jgi:hypothetical protein
MAKRQICDGVGASKPLADAVTGLEQEQQVDVRTRNCRAPSLRANEDQTGETVAIDGAQRGADFVNDRLKVR